MTASWGSWHRAPQRRACRLLRPRCALAFASCPIAVLTCAAPPSPVQLRNVVLLNCGGIIDINAELQVRQKDTARGWV